MVYLNRLIAFCTPDLTSGKKFNDGGPSAKSPMFLNKG